MTSSAINGVDVESRLAWWRWTSPPPGFDRTKINLSPERLTVG